MPVRLECLAQLGQALAPPAIVRRLGWGCLVVGPLCFVGSLSYGGVLPPFGILLTMPAHLLLPSSKLSYFSWGSPGLGALINVSESRSADSCLSFSVLPSGPAPRFGGHGVAPFHPDPAVQSAPVLPAKRSEFVPRSPNQVRSTLTNTAGTQRPITREYDSANTKCTTQISARAGPLDPGRAGRAGRRRRAHRPPVGNRGTTPATRARPKPVQRPRRFAG